MEAADEDLEVEGFTNTEAHSIISLIQRGQVLATQVKVKKSLAISLMSTTISLHHGDKSVLVSCLLDSGADGHGLDETLVPELGIPPKPKRDYHMSLAGGKTVTHKS